MRGYSAVSIERTPARTTAAGQAPGSAASGTPGLATKFERHRNVFMAGDEAKHFYEVESGAVMLYRILEDGRRQLVEVLFPGGVCGLTSGDVHESCCETLMPSVLRSHKKTDLARSEALRARVVTKLQAQFSAMHDHIVSLGRKTAEERICTLILTLREIEGLDGHHANGVSGAIELPMTRTEIADYLGLTLETVCRTLTELGRRKLVEAGRKKSEFKLVDLKTLKCTAHWDA